MSIGLETRLDLARAFYALTGSSANDSALKEHDAAAGDQLWYYLTNGAWAAQRYMIDHGWSDWWLKTSSTLSFTTGTERYAPLPDDFLELANDGGVGALRKADGIAYGWFVAQQELQPGRTDLYALRNDRIYVADGGAIPSLTLRYYYRHAPFSADATPITFPVEHRPLIVAEAATLAAADSWLPGGPEMEAKIDRAVNAARQRAASARRSREPRRYTGPAAFNGAWF